MLAYDAVLASRHGMGAAESRLATPVFAEAVRFALYAERVAPILEETRELVATDPPKGLGGPELTRYIAARGRARERLKALEAALYPPDEATDG